MAGAVPRRTSCTAPRAAAGLPSARQLTAQPNHRDLVTTSHLPGGEPRYVAKARTALGDVLRDSGGYRDLTSLRRIQRRGPARLRAHPAVGARPGLNDQDVPPSVGHDLPGGADAGELCGGQADPRGEAGRQQAEMSAERCATKDGAARLTRNRQQNPRQHRSVFRACRIWRPAIARHVRASHQSTWRIAKDRLSQRSVPRRWAPARVTARNHRAQQG